MDIKNLLKSNIWSIGMIGGIVLISSMFFIPLTPHW